MRFLSKWARIEVFYHPNIFSLFSECHHHHSFYMTFPLKVGCMLHMFILIFFLHSILSMGSTPDAFQCLRSSRIVSDHVLLGRPRLRYPATSSSVIFLIGPSLLWTCPYHCKRLCRTRVCRSTISSFSSRDSELILSSSLTPHIHLLSFFVLYDERWTKIVYFPKIYHK